MGIYGYGLLKPSRLQDAEAANGRLLGTCTLGIEVTEPELARRCGLGNIDPQHAGGMPGSAAIEACLWHIPPPAGARLVTIRPDLDALGGMAVLSLRAGGAALTPALRERVRCIAAADIFAHGPWPGRRPMPRRIGELDELGDPDLATVGGAAADPALAVEARVEMIARWLVGGAEPGGGIARHGRPPGSA